MGDLTRALFPQFFRDDRYGRTGWWWWLHEVTPEHVLRTERRLVDRAARRLEREQTQLEQRIAAAKAKATKTADVEAARRHLQDAVRDRRAHARLARQKDQLGGVASAIGDALTGTHTTHSFTVLARVMQARAAVASPRQMMAVMHRYSTLREQQRVVEADFAACFAAADDDDDAAEPNAATDDVYELAVQLGLEAPSQYRGAAEPDSPRRGVTPAQRVAAEAARDEYDRANVVDDDVDTLLSSYGTTTASARDSSVEHSLVTRLDSLRRA